MKLIDFKKTVLLTALIAVSTAQFTYAKSLDSDNDGVPDIAESLIHTDPLNADTDGDGLNDLQDDNPVYAAQPLVINGAPSPIVIVQALVEDNYDYVKKQDAEDHLELVLENASNEKLSNITVTYRIGSPDTGVTERYVVPLLGLSIAKNEKIHVHFDQNEAPKHFRANPNSIYKTEPSAKLFSISVTAQGFKPASIDLKKDTGGAETAD